MSKKLGFIGMALVVDLGEVLLHFIELHALHIDPRVLLTVCNAGLQAHVQVGVRDGSGGSTHCLEGHVNGLHTVGAHLQALQAVSYTHLVDSAKWDSVQISV